MLYNENKADSDHINGVLSAGPLPRWITPILVKGEVLRRHNYVSEGLYETDAEV